MLAVLCILLLTLEAMPGCLINLLRLCNLLEDVLDNETIVASSITAKRKARISNKLSIQQTSNSPWRKLNVVVGTDYVDVDLALAWVQEDALVDLELREVSTRVSDCSVSVGTVTS